MIASEKDHCEAIMRLMAKGKGLGHVLAFDRKTKKLTPKPRASFSWGNQGDPDGPIQVGKDDCKHFGADDVGDGQIVITGECLEQLRREGKLTVNFRGIAEEKVFTLLNVTPSLPSFHGTLIYVEREHPHIMVDYFGEPEDVVRVAINGDTVGLESPLKVIAANSLGFARIDGNWVRLPLQIVPTRVELFSRINGLIETDVLAKMRVAVFGVGSGGAPVAVELTKSGVGIFDLIDHDRQEVGNVIRHPCGISDVGRYKPLAAADVLREKNPFVEVKTWPLKVGWDCYDTVKEICQAADLVIIATDNHTSRLVINKACVETNRTCIIGGAYRRAYGGQVIRVRPFESCCYQCFSMMLPDRVEDQEISGEEQAERLSYTDREVAVEPGLSADIAPISLLMVKLAIQELLKGTETTLRLLDEDLSANWYIWLGRREIGTQFENLKPLGNNVDGMHILRWYGVDVERHPGCPVCGDFNKFLEDPEAKQPAELLKHLTGLTQLSAEQ